MATNRLIGTTVMAQLEHLGEEVEGVYLPDIVKMIPDTIRDIVVEVAQMGLTDERKLFTKTFALTITTVADDFDTVDLSSSVLAADALLVHLPFPRVTHGTKAGANFQELFYVADKATLELVTPADGYNYYTVDDRILFINANPELTGTLNVNSFYVTAISNLPRQFEGRLVAKLVEKVQGLKR